MGVLSFWKECAKRAAKGASPFANDWQWIFGIPFWYSGLGVSITAALYHQIVSSGQSAMTTGYPAIDSILVGLAAFVVTWLVAFCGRLLQAPVALHDEAVQRARAAEAQLDEFAYSLHLESVNREQFHAMDKGTKELLKAEACLALMLRNALNKPIGYAVRRLVLDGVEQTNFLNRGGVIPAATPTKFSSERHEIDIATIDELVMQRLELEITYGPPTRHSRLTKKVLRLESFPQSGRTNMLYEVDEDERLRVE